MTTEERIKEQWAMVEKISRIYEKKGFGLIFGRIIGLLSVMDKEQYTFDELVEELKISKSSASNALKLLEARNLIEYTTLAGDRRRYFKIRTQDKFAIIDEHHNTIKMTRDLFESILALKANKDSANAVFLKDAMDLLSIFLDRFEALRLDYLNKK